VRAGYVEEGHDIERILIVVGFTFAEFLGPRYQQETIWKLQEGFAAVRQELPLPVIAR